MGPVMRERTRGCPPASVPAGVRGLAFMSVAAKASKATKPANPERQAPFDITFLLLNLNKSFIVSLRPSCLVAAQTLVLTAYTATAPNLRRSSKKANSAVAAKTPVGGSGSNTTDTSSNDQ